MDILTLMTEMKSNNVELNISTMTIIGVLNKEKIDLQRFYDHVSKKTNIIVKYSPNNRDYVLTKRGKKKKNFFNQVTINIQDITKKSIKIFLNGKIQVTGVVAECEFKLISEYICKLLQECFEQDIQLLSYKIGMINSNFHLQWNIDLHKFQSILEGEQNVISRYDPDTYPAINMKYYFHDNRVSLFIFNSGNIVITGAKSILDISVTYKYIIKILTQYKQVIKLSNNEKIMKKVQPIVHGYPLKQLLLTMS